MQPPSVMLLPRCRQRFTEPTAVTWSISPAFGTIAPDGLYTAPYAVWLSRTVTVTALDGAGHEIGHSTVTVSSAKAWLILLGIFWTVLSFGLLVGIFAWWPPPARPASVSIYPPGATLINGESLQFLSSAIGSGDTTVIWSATGGDITPSGVFSAPAAPKTGDVTVTATRNSDHTQTASAQVIVNAAHLIMNRSVVDASGMKDGDKIPFQAMGPSGPAAGLQWYLSGPGEIATNGTYTVHQKSAAQAVVTAIDPATGRKAATVILLLPADVVGDGPMLLLVALMGAFGALLAATRSFVNFVGSRSFVPSWSFYYLFRPMFGTGLALIVFFAYRIGAVSGPKGGTPADPFTAAFVAGMVGLFADTVLQKLKELVEQLFRPQDTRSDKLSGEPQASVPAITKLTVANGVLTVEGNGFASGASVSLNGHDAPTTFVDPTRLTVTPLPAGLAGLVSVIVTNRDGRKSAAGNFAAT
ncbi:MAG TPA: IPT/TIG domain-containing protein [Bryobacteraceae bacterium]